MPTVVAIFKDEGPYLAEWILFHRRQGFDNFMLFDNESTDDGPYIARRLGAEVIHWPGKVQQLAAYDHAMNELPLGSWAAFIDIDEYLWCPDGSTVMSKVYAYYTWQNALGVPWLMFGSNGHIQKPEQLTIDAYTKREDGVNPHVKQMMTVDPRAHWRDPHHTNIPYELTIPHIFCNHYWSRSVEEVTKKFDRGRADLDIKRSLTEFWAGEKVNNVVEDKRLAMQASLTLSMDLANAFSSR